MKLNNINSMDYTNNDISLFESGLQIYKRRKLIGYVIGISIVLTIFILLLIPNEYRSQASILPSGNTESFGDLAGLADLGILTKPDENSSDLFPVILSSYQVTNGVLKEKYSFTNDGDKYEMTLVEYFDLELADELYEELLDITDIEMDKKNGVITLGVTTKYPEFSQKILEKYLVELENFNLYKRASQAKDNVKYLLQQLDSKKKELEKLQAEVEDFQAVNRDWLLTTDPEILKKVANYQRDLEILNKAYVFLNQEYEMAKFESQKDVPIVRILDTPTLPDKKVYPPRALFLIIITMLVFMMTCFGIVAYDAILNLINQNKDKPENDFSELFKSTANRVTKFVNSLGRKDSVDM